MRNSLTRTRLAAALACAAVLALPGCKKAETAAAPSAQPSDKTLAASLAGDSDLSAVSGALKDTGLAQVFDGAAPYTILAPTDSAFGKLGSAGAELRKPEQHAAMAALLRDHIVPGYLTPGDINQALDRAAGNAVKMKTMGGHLISFSHTGKVITVTHEDGSRADISGDPLLAGNGVALPIDAVLKKLD
jgi:uncharacterized surface protein with fasciclin (FAS1) repeats